VILEGSIKFKFSLPDNMEDKVEKVVSAGTMVKIKPVCIHVLTAVDGPATALELSPQKLDLKDIITA
jgi:hypothetical protein